MGKEINFKIISAALSSTKLKDQDKLAIVVDQLSSYIPNPTQTIETKVLQSLLEGLYQYSAQNPQAIELFFNGLTQYIRTKQLKQEGYLFLLLQCCSINRKEEDVVYLFHAFSAIFPHAQRV